MTRNAFAVLLSVFLLVAAPGQLWAIANCPGVIGANFTLSEDIHVTSNTSCITVNANGLVVNLAGYSIICDNAAGCQYGVYIPSATNTIVRNGDIVAGSGEWAVGVANLSSSGSVLTTTVNDVTITDTPIGILNPYVYR